MSARFLVRNGKQRLFLLALLYSLLVVIKLCFDGRAIEVSSSHRRKLSNRSLKVETMAITEELIRASCPRRSPFLRGSLPFIDLNDTSIPSSVSDEFGGEVKRGGTWQPKYCTARKKIAVLIPYRNRTNQLNVFLRHMHPIFQRQLLDYRIFLIEQAGKEKFNKGAIYNIGFNASLAFGDYDCHIFHDIDLLCETDTNYYGCTASPMHLSVAIDKFNYKLSYQELIGGVQVFTKDHYIEINGYSNMFWGWGGEDDNLYTRIKAKALALVRPSIEVARYKMNQLYHYRSDGWSKANQVLLYHRRPKQAIDGVNSIAKLKFSIETQELPLYTHISIDLRKT